MVGLHDPAGCVKKRNVRFNAWLMTFRDLQLCREMALQKRRSYVVLLQRNVFDELLRSLYHRSDKRAHLEEVMVGWLLFLVRRGVGAVGMVEDV